MKLIRIKLCNYRCFGEEQVIDIDDINVFIGNNSAGKTASLSALNCVFSSNPSERLLKRSDFHLPKNVKPEDMEEQNLYIETVFTFDELEKEAGNKTNGVPTFFQSMVVDEPDGTPYLRIRLEATWQSSNNIEGSIESRLCYITCSEKEAITEDNRVTANRRDLDNIRVIYVPAVRDPGKQLKNASGTMMYQLMNSIIWSNETKDSIQTQIKTLNSQFMKEKGVAIIGSSIHSQWEKYDTDKKYSNAQLRFNSIDIDTSIRKSEVVFTPTEIVKEYTIDEMSDGLRSLFYVSMVDSILDVELKIEQDIRENPENPGFSKKPPILTIIALEEPENHIAPHLLGKLIGNLNSIAKKANAQTLMTSHSPAIVKRISPEKIRYFRMKASTLSTSVKKIILPDTEKESDQYKFVKEAVIAYPEIYFAKLVVLGEGDSEEILIPKFIEEKGWGIDSSGISVVPLSGRFVNHFWRLLDNLKIPHITLLDLDCERYGGGWGRISYVIKQLLLLGIPREKLVTLEGGKVMTDDDIEKIKDWDVSNEKLMSSWLGHLEHFNVYFSSPLDIDFLMLEHYLDYYKKTLLSKEGPRLEIINQEGKKERPLITEIENAPEYQAALEKRIANDVHATLKENGGDGSTYTEDQKKLMLWYNYFFLNRGKPTTHIAAISKMDDFTLVFDGNELMDRFVDAIEELLKNEDVLQK